MSRSLTLGCTYIFICKNWLLKFLILCTLNAGFLYSIYHVYTAKIAYDTIEFWLWTSCALFCYFTTSGYCAKYTQNFSKLHFEDPEMLPSWKGQFTNYFLIGVKKIIFYIIYTLNLLPYFISFHFVALPQQAIDIAIEGSFCLDFDGYKSRPDIEWMLEEMAANILLYLRMGFTLFFLLFFPVLGLVYTFYAQIKIPHILIIISVVYSYYHLVYAYMAAISANLIKNYRPI